MPLRHPLPVHLVGFLPKRAWTSLFHSALILLILITCRWREWEFIQKRKNRSCSCSAFWSITSFCYCAVSMIVVKLLGECFTVTLSCYKWVSRSTSWATQHVTATVKEPVVLLSPLVEAGLSAMQIRSSGAQIATGSLCDNDFLLILWNARVKLKHVHH